MSKNNTPQEKWEVELKQEEHDHNNPTAAAMTQHIIASIHTLHVKLHQYHWYVKGPHFFTLHEKFEELYDENDKWFDELAEKLLASGEKPVSTTEQFLKYTVLTEDGAEKYLTADKMVHSLIEDYRKVRDITGVSIKMAGDEENFVLEDTLIEYKEHIDFSLWTLQAYLGNEAYDGDDAMEDDED